jgi:hypothetical protein
LQWNLLFNNYTKVLELDAWNILIWKILEDSKSCYVIAKTPCRLKAETGSSNISLKKLHPDILVVILLITQSGLNKCLCRFGNGMNLEDGQDGYVGKVFDYRPRCTRFDPCLCHKRRSTWATNSCEIMKICWSIFIYLFFFFKESLCLDGLFRVVPSTKCAQIEQLTVSPCEIMNIKKVFVWRDCSERF